MNSACDRECHVTCQVAEPRQSRAPLVLSNSRERVYNPTLARWPAHTASALCCKRLLTTMFSLSALDELDKQTGASLRMHRVHAAV